MKVSGRPKIVGPYRIGERLGRGAYGQVFKALNLQNGQTVAIKVVRLSEDEFKSVRKEVKMLRMMNHPNIVTYIDCFKHENNAFIVLQYLECGSLLLQIPKDQPLPQSLVACFVKQILEGLHFLHSKGVVHRDIKAANLLLDKKGIVKLADFGVAKQLTETSKENSAKGTPYWMAPQVVQLGDVTTACDIWSLGCTIIQLVTGKCPYHDLLPYPAMMRIVQDPHPHFPKISSLGLQFLKLCFDKDPSKRPSAVQLLAHQWLNIKTPKRSISQNLADEHSLQAINSLLRETCDSLQSEQQSKLVAFVSACQQLKSVDSSLLENSKIYSLLDKLQPKSTTIVLVALLDLIILLLPLAKSIERLSESGVLQRVLWFLSGCYKKSIRSKASLIVFQVSQKESSCLLRMGAVQSLCGCLRLNYQQNKEIIQTTIQCLDNLLTVQRLSFLRPAIARLALPRLLSLRLRDIQNTREGGRGLELLERVEEGSWDEREGVRVRLEGRYSRSQ